MPPATLSLSFKLALHFFHMYAVRDRFDSSDDPVLYDLENCEILPSLENDTVLWSHASVLAARIIRKGF